MHEISSGPTKKDNKSVCVCVCVCLCVYPDVYEIMRNDRTCHVRCQIVRKWNVFSPEICERRKIIIDQVHKVSPITERGGTLLHST